jgi:hypothetical protein
MPELNETGLLAQLQNLPKQFAKRLRVPPAEIRDGPKIRGIERHNAVWRRQLVRPDSDMLSGMYSPSGSSDLNF